MGVAKIFQGGGQHGHFVYLFLVAQVAMQMNVYKTLYCFYTTKKMPHETRAPLASILKSFSSGPENEFATKVCFASSVTAFLAHKCRYNCELHTSESEMDLN